MLPQRLADPFYATAKQYWKNPNGNRAATRYIVIHHAAADYPPGQAVRRIYEYHAAKWPAYHAIAYHEVIQIEPDGSLRAYQTNPVSIVGAGVYRRNDDTYHICAATHFGATIPLQLWQDALALRAAEAKRHWPAAEIVGHRDIAMPGYATSCPGGAWAHWKPSLLARVAALLAPADPFAGWGPIDLPTGEQRGWLIPQTWLRNQWLGRCLLGEFWPVADVCSVACFEHGCVVYEKAADKARIVRFGGAG